MATKKKPVKKAAKAPIVSVKESSSDHGPIVVKIISILGYIGAGFSILLGFFFLFGGPLIASMMPMMETSSIPSAVLGIVFIVMAIILIVLGVACIFISKALWDHKNWARIVMIVLSALGLIGGLTNLPQSILGILINGGIIYFLAFDKNVVKLFE